MSPAPAANAGKPIQLRFEDNALLPLLFGEHDQNLARIEQTLGVSLSPRGNRLAIRGEAADIARAALGTLYDRIKGGLPIDLAEVDAALRLAGQPQEADADLVIQTRKRRITPRSIGQAEYIRALRDSEMVFCVGPAGTGKTYLAVAMAASMMLRGEVDRIILSRPAVEAGERLGFLPGDLREKIDPYLRPLYDALYDMLPADLVAKRLGNGEIEVAPLAFMRGRTLSSAFIILDEAQNTTPVQMKMFLTRLGENSRMVITGDTSQIDLPSGVGSGLLDALETVDGVEGVALMQLSAADVVRHDLVSRLVRAYDRQDRKRGKIEKGGPAVRR